MSRKRNYTQAMTLRLDPAVDDLLTSAAHDRRMSKAAYVRSALRQFLGQQRMGKEPLVKEALRRIQD